MKKLEELGIRPAPWSAKNRLGHRVFDRSGFEICDSDSAYSDVDSRLIAAAPEMYQCLGEAVDFHCGKCINKGGQCNPDCLFYKWRKTLAKAAGEEVTK